MTRRDEVEIAREVAETTLEAHASITEQMVNAIAGEVPQYSTSVDADAVLADVGEHCDAQLQAFLSSFLSDIPPEALDIGFAEDAVTRRVRQGVPLEAILHSFRIGHQVAWSAIVEHADRVPGGRTAAVLLVEPSIRFIDAMSTLVADVYVREQQRAIAVADRERRDVLELLLTDPTRALQAARSAGIPLDPEAMHCVLTATIGAGDADALQTFEDALTKAFEPGVVFAVVRHNAVTMLLRGPIERAAARAAEAIRTGSGQSAGTAAVGIGLPVDGVQQLGRAHQQAMTALGLATSARPVVALADMPVTDYLVASADRIAHSMVPDSVRTLAQSKRTSDIALVQTLRVYMSSGLNVQQTAASLPAHPNTVHGRLRRLAAKTGYSLHDAEQLLRLSIELRLAEHR